MVNLWNLKLDLGCNQIGKQGVIKMMESLESLSKLKELSFNCSDNIFDKECMESMKQYLPSSIENLELILNDTQMDSDGLVPLKELLIRLNLNQLILDLNDNMIKTEGVVNLCAGIQSLTQLKSLSLYLFNTKIGNEGVE